MRRYPCSHARRRSVRRRVQRRSVIQWPRAMAIVELTRKIEVPPEHLFAFFVPQRMPYWYGAEMDSCFEVQDGAADFRVGLKVRISGQLGGKTVSHTVVVTAVEFPRLLELAVPDLRRARQRALGTGAPAPRRKAAPVAKQRCDLSTNTQCPDAQAASSIAC